MNTFKLQLPWGLVFLLLFSFAERPKLCAQIHRLNLGTGTIDLPENVLQYDPSSLPASASLGDQRYVLIEFFELPNARQRQSQAEEGIFLLDYLHGKTYLAALSERVQAGRLQAWGVRSVVPLPAFAKWDPRLDTWQDTEQESVEVILLMHKNLRETELQAYLQKDEIRVVRHRGRLWRVQLPASRLSELPELPYVAWIEPVPPRGEPEDTRGRSLLRVNAINGLLPSSYHFDGSGVGVLVRDDGALGPHIDFHGRLHNAVGFSLGGTHGDGVGGIMAGAGNLDPYMQGMASGAEVYAIPYQADFLDNTLDLHIEEGVLVTNSSYSNGCNTGYTAIAREVDQQMYDYPTLLHVFSAGNSNNNDCGYGAGAQWGNITGGHKQGKNVIATANLHQNGNLVNSSSRGPAYDGRIKPDIAANGAGHYSTSEGNTYQEFGGTSGAAPCIAGIAAQLHQAYQTWNAGNLAPAALIKTVLLNTATDLGEPGPDFKYGWGQANALRALRALEEGRYAEASLDQGENASFSLEIPAGLAQAKIMLYWADVPAFPDVPVALVNDLDLTLEAPDGTIYLPHVPDHTPDPDQLDLPAAPGEDHLNNVEQVALENPMPGNWTVHVNGYAIPQGPQTFYIQWDFWGNSPEITYPAGGEGFVPGSVERIHWDAYGSDGSFELEYSIDSGQVWNALATLNGDERMFDWLVPEETSGQAFLRISRNGQSDQSEVFSIIGVPENLVVEMACPDSLQLSWDPVAGAVAYDFFMLGDRFMDSIATTPTNSISIPTINSNPSLDYWFAVRAVSETGLPGQRSIAVFFNDGLFNCLLDNDLALSQLNAPNVTLATGCSSFYSEVSVQLTNNGQNPIENPVLSYQLNDQPIVQESTTLTLMPGQSLEYVFDAPLSLDTNGDYELAIWGNTPADEAFFNDTLVHIFSLSIYPGNGEQPGYAEDFEAGSLPPYWDIFNPDLGISWELRDDIIGSDGNTTHCYYVNNYAYSDQGQEDALISVPFDLTQIGPDEHVALTFDLAYAYYSENYLDAFRVDIYTDCGSTFAATLYEKAGSELQTDPPTTSIYTPSGPGSWRREFINLDAYKGESVVLRFVNITGYGNSLFIDNIGLVQGLPPTAGFDASSTTICQNEALLFISTASGEDISYQWNFGNGASPSSAVGPGPYVVFYTQVGPQVVTQTVVNGFGEDSYQEVITVAPAAQAAFSYTYQGYGKYQFSSNSVSADTYLWDFGDGNTSTEANPLHQYQVGGNYTVSLAIDGPCGDAEVSEEIDVITASGEAYALPFAVYPNPSTGSFRIRLQHAANWTWEIKDLQGRVLLQAQHSLSADEWQLKTDLPSGAYLLSVRDEQGRKSSFLLHIVR